MNLGFAPFSLSVYVLLSIWGGLNLSLAALSQEPPELKAVHKPIASKAGRDEIRELARKGLFDSALILSQRALKADSTDAFASFMSGKLSLDAKVSAEYFQKAIRLGGGGSEAEESYFRLGQYYYAAGKYHRAIPFFRDYLKVYPEGDWNEPARYWMGNACLSYVQSQPDKVGHLDSALAYFETLIDRNQVDDYYLPLALEGQAKSKAAKGDLEGAWASAKAALEKAPEEERPALLLLSAQLRQGTDRGGESSFINDLLSAYPQSPESRYLRKSNAGLKAAQWRAGSGFKIRDPIKSSTRAADSIAMTPSAITNEKPFTLQLGAFSQSPNAKAMIATVTKLGLAPEMISSTRNGKPIFQVRLGRFSTPEEASEYAVKNLKPHQLLSQPVPLTP